MQMAPKEVASPLACRPSYRDDISWQNCFSWQPVPFAVAIHLQALSSSLQASQLLELTGPLQDERTLKGDQHAQGEYRIIPVTK